MIFDSCHHRSRCIWSSFSFVVVWLRVTKQDLGEGAVCRVQEPLGRICVGGEVKDDDATGFGDGDARLEWCMGGSESLLPSPSPRCGTWLPLAKPFDRIRRKSWRALSMFTWPAQQPRFGDQHFLFFFTHPPPHLPLRFSSDRSFCALTINENGVNERRKQPK